MVVPIHQLLPGLLPQQQHYGEAESGNTQQEEGEGSSSEDAVDAWAV